MTHDKREQSDCCSTKPESTRKQKEHNMDHGKSLHDGHHAGHDTKAGGHCGDMNAGHDHHAMMVADFKKRFWISLVVTIPILLLSPMLQQWFGLTALGFAGDRYVLFVLASFVFFYGGWPFLKGMWDEVTAKNPGMMTLIGVATTVAYIYSSAVVFGLEGKTFFWELATLIDIMLVGHWIEMRSIMGASRALEELAKLLPGVAHKVDAQGNVTDIPLEELAVDDHVLVKPGEKIPADGTIVKGATSVNEAMLTGESKPVEKTIGDQVIGGSINGEGSMTVSVSSTGKDSFLSQVIDLVKEAQSAKSKTQDLANRAALWLTIISISVGFLTFFIWMFFTSQDLAFALERTVTVMVITCPHALGLAIPLVVAVSTALSARNGLLIRNRTAFEEARNLRAVIFDKTGTLTRGEFGVTDMLVLSETYSKEQLLELAAAVESHSEHPIARGITAEINKPKTVEQFNAIPGKGAEGIVDGLGVKVVSPGYLEEKNISFENSEVDTLSSQGKTVVFVLVEEKLHGAIALADIIRPEAKLAVAQLKELGIQSMMLTGDNAQVAKWVADEIGLDDYFAEVLPDEKARKVTEVQKRGLTVAMVGDGVNDAPALATADVGIAIGAGTDVAVETADIILVKNNPQDVANVLHLARATYRKMIQNLIWATGYNVVAIPLAAGVLSSFGILLSPAVGAVLMSLSTVIVAINARFLKIQ